MNHLITTTDWVRIAFLYGHLVFCTFAITAVLKADIEIMSGRYSKSSLEFTATVVAALLAALWFSGLCITYIDTGFDPAILLSKSKLLLKLMCVVTLTLNGIVLHYISFPLVVKENDLLTVKEAALLAVTGALSTSHWMLAAFVGLSQPLGRLPLNVLMSAYGVFVFSVLVTSLLFVPLLYRRQLQRTSAQCADVKTA